VSDRSSHEPAVQNAGDPLIAELIRLAGPRPQPAPFRAARVRAVVEAEWRRSVQPPRSRGAWRYIAAAAALLFAVALWMGPSWDRPAGPLAIGTTEAATFGRVIGNVEWMSAGRQARPVKSGDRVRVGDVIATSATGRVSLLFADGRSVRLDRGARVLIETSTVVRLEQGRLYVDSGGAQSKGSFVIATASGPVREAGTQFVVEAAESSVEIRVREGAVRIDGPQGSLNVAAAEAMLIPRNARPTRRPIALHGAEWAWVEALSAPFKIEGAKLEMFLDWAARELGMPWSFTDAAAARHGRAVVLHGSIDGLTPREALDAVLPATGMTHDIQNGKIRVSLVSR
jgi:ferric-dicitrate binding protein FerR (iron transport regulator)